MPVTDKRNTTGDTAQSNESLSNIEKILSERITDKNYDIISPGSVKNIIKEKANENKSPEELCLILKVDGILNEISMSIDRGFHSLPDGKGRGIGIIKQDK